MSFLANMAKNKQAQEGTNYDSSSEPRSTSDSDPINEIRLNFRSVKVLTGKIGVTEEAPIFWPSSANDKYRCIYRVPSRLRKVNPEAYTPQMLLIGPIHYSKSRCSEYEKMERHKKKYLEHFKLVFGNQSVDELRRTIKKDEQIIRAHYAEPMDEIKSHNFVEMMLHDSVFILIFFWELRCTYIEKTGDFILDEPCHQTTIFQDLILVENQLPFSLLEGLFQPLFEKFDEYFDRFTFRELVLQNFQKLGKFKSDIKFLHFTDLLRSICVETLEMTKEEQDNAIIVDKMIDNLHKAHELDSVGVKFESVDEENEIKELPSSLVIRFENGTLKMSSFLVTGNTETFFSNIMILEQCHYPLTAFVSNYINFLNLLIDTGEDVGLLVKQGVIVCLGLPESTAKLVNTLCSEKYVYGSQYYKIAEMLNNHYNSHLNRAVATLKQVYFKDLWTGTATVSAVILLVLTLIATVTSVLQVTQEDNKSN